MHTEVIKTILLLNFPRVTFREYYESRHQQHLINFNSVPEDIIINILNTIFIMSSGNVFFLANSIINLCEKVMTRV